MQKAALFHKCENEFFHVNITVAMKPAPVARSIRWSKLRQKLKEVL